MASAKRPPINRPSHDHKLTTIQAKRLSGLAGVEASELEGLSYAQASDRLRWIDPQLFWFREICGKVVKKDPVTGVEYPVPFATVNVQETECDLISYFPERSPWAWHLPIFCRRETIGTVQTDACGNFCVWVPRFEIEWILRWREIRLCFPIIFNRPIFKDLIPELIPVKKPGPPDPGPLHSLTALPTSTLQAIAGAGAATLSERVNRLQASQTLGAPNTLTGALLHRRVFDTELSPPLPHEFRQALTGKGRIVAAEGASSAEGVRAAVALKLGIDPEAETLLNLDLSRFIGPFWRCIDIFVPEWQLIFEVPDITFEVTQEIGGVTQVIYDDPFGVNWNVNPTPSVTLVASPIARESNICGTPEVECGDTPAILFAGLMPLDNPSFFDASTGYVTRVNRPANGVGDVTPTPSDLSRPPAQTPFCETVQLYGCVNVSVDGVAAQYYRVRQSFNGGAFTPITGVSWNIYTFPGGAPVTVSPDADGWYPVIPDPDDFFPERLVLDWPTPSLGEFTLEIEVGDALKNVIATSAAVPLQVDNTAPTPLYQTLSWKFVGEPDSAFRSLLGEPCPIIHRGSTPAQIEVLFEVNVSAAHLRDAYISVDGCGGGSFVLQGGSSETYHWHTSVGDDSVLLNGRYRLDATALDGCYSFSCRANSRAMNPDGSDTGTLHPTDWYEDPIYIYANPSISVAVVSED